MRLQRVGGRTAPRAGPSARPATRLVPLRASSSRTPPPRLEDLAQTILQKESALKDAFQPGRAMPSGREVAGMRAEVKRLRGELAERISRQPDWRGGSHGVSQEIASLIAMVAAQRARESVSNVEHYMSSAGEHSAHSGASLSEKEFLQLEMLQLENDELRKRAEGLLRRQQYLEDLMRENGLAPPGGQEAASLQPAEAEQAPTEDKPYYMSSPSWY